VGGHGARACAGRCCSVTTSATRGLGYRCTGRDTASLLPSHSGAVSVTSHCLAWELIARALHRDDCYRGPPTGSVLRLRSTCLSTRENFRVVQRAIHPRYFEQANNCDCDYQHERDEVLCATACSRHRRSSSSCASSTTSSLSRRRNNRHTCPNIQTPKRHRFAVQHQRFAARRQRRRSSRTEPRRSASSSMNWSASMPANLTREAAREGDQQ
jgi:hypothetical protein